MGCEGSKICNCTSNDIRKRVYEENTSIDDNNYSLTFINLMSRKLICCGYRNDVRMTKIERTMKAALLIQKWYRRYMARLEIRRRYTWTIFQSIEYAGEQDQVRLYNFFNALLKHIPNSTYPNNDKSCKLSSHQSIDLNMTFEDEYTADDDLLCMNSKKDENIKLEFPLTEEKLKELIESFRKSKHYRLHAQCVADILRHSILKLKTLPNLNVTSTEISKQITVCGDLHGKFDDLIVVFHKNGLPSLDNPYVFNGDFVDRGKQGLEVLLILLCCLLVYPNGVFLNRGNHEDHIMNTRYGFIREIQMKYRKNSENLLKLIEEMYRWLPLGTIINKKVLIVHGGISDATDLEIIKTLKREKYVSILRPPIYNTSSAPGGELINKLEWKQVFDILWSDPQGGNGCKPNTLRGAGTFFGPDITKNFLEKTNMMYLIRSHECKPDGYELTHNDSVITIFSASNYYELGSNKGAYLKLVGPKLDLHFVQYMAAEGKAKKLPFHKRIGLIEASAIREMNAQIMAKRDELEEEFQKEDIDGTGLISISKWCEIMLKFTELNIPWRMLKDKFVNVDINSQKIIYNSLFDNINNQNFNSIQGANSVVEILYRNKSSLETIFRIIDKDKSGFINLEELSEACNLIKEHMPSPMTQEQLLKICHLMDINKDGKVDLNEFLETFRLVDPHSKNDI